MKAKITDNLVRKAAVPSRGYSLTWDTVETGFGLRVSAGGARAFVVAYTTTLGKERRMTLGRYPALSVTAARRRAVAERGRVYGGGDPMQERRDRREQARNTESAPTMADLRRRYLEEYVGPRRAPPGLTNEARYWRTISEHVPEGLLVSALTHAAVQKMHHTLSHKPVEANRVISSLSTALNCASKWGWVTKNVASGVHRNPESPRERYLTDTEIERLNGAIDAHPVRDSALAVRFLLLTGARKGETLRARWEDIDLSNGLWSKPAATTKGKRIHRTVLSNAAVALLEEIRARHPEGEFVFPGATNKPLTSFKRTWMTIRRGANLPGFRLHDLRHSHASLMARNGAGLLMIGTALGHTQPSTTKRYAHLTDEALRQTLNQVGEYASIGVATPMCKYLQNSDQIQNGYFD